jgi:hypothetical protein
MKMEKRRKKAKGVCAPTQQQICDRHFQDLRVGQLQIIKRLDSVAANGNPGLEASFRDIFSKVKETHGDIIGLKSQIAELMHITESSRNWYNMFTAIKKVSNNSVLIRFLKTKGGQIVVLIVGFIVLTSILKFLHINVALPDMMDMVKQLVG